MSKRSVVLVGVTLLLAVAPFRFSILAPKTLMVNEQERQREKRPNLESLDLIPGLIILAAIGFTVYLYEWIKRKLIQRRIFKLRAVLEAETERLRETDAKREQLEGTLKLARDVAAEYDLLYMLLRKRQSVPEFNQYHFI